MRALGWHVAGFAFAVMGVVYQDDAKSFVMLTIMCAATASILRALEKRP